MATIPESVLARLQDPKSGQGLVAEADRFMTPDGEEVCPISEQGIPLFAKAFCSNDAERQQAHYDTVSKAYIENLTYPHTQVYTDFMDRLFLDRLASKDLGDVAEICCGRGEALRLLLDQEDVQVKSGLGIDISTNMLKAARAEFSDERFYFAQGDATKLPLVEGSFDNVFMFGGIHHVNDREALFSEIFRILKPGGRFYYREPLDDFILWRALRAVIYKISPALDHLTERPLRYQETVPILEKLGFEHEVWRSCGFIGFCFLMNSDVLFVNRLFRFIPGIRAFTKLWTWIDEISLKVPGFRNAGTQVIGVAKKTGERSS